MILTVGTFWREVKNMETRRSGGVLFTPIPLSAECPRDVFLLLEKHIKALHVQGIVKSRLGLHREHCISFDGRKKIRALLWVHLNQKKYPDVSICAKLEKNAHGHQVSIGLMYTPTLERMVKNMRGTESVLGPVDL